MSQTPPVRIAFVEQDWRIGGAEVNLLELLPRLDHALLDPVVLCRKTGPLTEALSAREQQWELVRIPPLASVSARVAGRKMANPAACLWDLGALATASRRVAAYCLRNSIGLVFTNGLFSHIYGGLAARSAGIPCVWHLQDIVSGSRSGGLFRASLRWCARRVRPSIISISAPVSRTVDGLGLDIVEVPNGVDVTAFGHADGTAFRQELGIGEDDFAVGIVGRITPWKGQREFVQAGVEAAAANPHVHLVIVGDASPSDAWYLNQVKQIALNSSLGSRVHLTGFRPDIPQVMAALDVLVLASQEPEPFGRTIIEAMAAGVPVIATRAGGVGDIVVPGQTGLLVAPGDHKGLLSAIERLAARPEERMSLGARAKADVGQRFSLDSSASAISEVISRLVRRRPC